MTAKFHGNWRTILVGLHLFALAGAVACSGADGAPGAKGADGKDGVDGTDGTDGGDGADGTLCSVADNGNGTFTMTCGDDSVTYGETEEPAAYTGADGVRGGALYDKYWAVTGDMAPTGEHALYPAFGAKKGADTWRCKECHGWDYLGRDGRYKSGSHYTGIAGLYPATLSLWKAFSIIKDGHGYGAAGLADADIWDLVKFYREQLVDTGLVLAADGSFKGDAGAGAKLYDNGIPGFDANGKAVGAACATCHGADGTAAVVPDFSAFPGFLSNENPPEFMHKVRFGHPGSNPSMPAAAAIGGSLRDVADVSAYSQTLSPVDWSTTKAGRGGQLYDKYWPVTQKAAPSGKHALYPAAGKKTGADTWRCKECHGWDYIGRDGRYSSGSHYTGIGGLFPARLTKWQAFETIKVDHGYGNGQLADKDIWDLVAFYVAGMYDINFILKPDGKFSGNAATGKTLYDNGIGGAASCATCHGADGLTKVVPSFTAYPGFLSNDNPQEFAHKVLFGFPGTGMPITYDFGATLQNAGDLSAYAQTLPQN